MLRMQFFMLLPLCWVGTSHPMAPTCHGFGGPSCSTADPGSSGKRRGSAFSGTTLAVKVDVSGCHVRACWLQGIRVGVDDTNSVDSLAKVGVYRSDGALAATSAVLRMPTNLQDHAWFFFPLQGYDKELQTLSEHDHVWVVFNTEATVKLTYETAASSDQATRTVSEEFNEAFAVTRDWTLEPGRRQWAGLFRQLRVQLDLGDISVLPGTLPLILEAPHGGRITAGWPQRLSGTLNSDQNTDLFAEELRSALTARCGHSPRAVILHVDRQGIDGNRATGNGSHTRSGESCASQSNGQCCCHLANASDMEVAMDLNDIYHTLLAEQVAQANGALLVNIHATGRHRVEVGLRLSASDLNSGAALSPPSLADHDADCSLRALGHATELVWGASSLGALIKDKRPTMEVVPSPQLRCPDASICPSSSYSKLFMGGHNLKIHVSDQQPGVQLELPQVMRGFGSSPPVVEPAAVRQVAAALSAFLNLHYSENCEADVNFGLTCVHGDAVYGACVCHVGYVGMNCADCDEGFLEKDGQCIRLVMLEPPEGVTQKYGSAFPTTSSGKKYLYTRKFNTQLSDCGAGCRPLDISLRMRCDGNQCHNDLDATSYVVGVALYDATGHRLCNGTTGTRTPQAATDWWLQVPLHSCPLLQMGASHSSVYLSMWTSKWLKLRWEQEPTDPAARSKGLQYKSEEYAQDPSAHSIENLVDAVPPSQLPSWRDVVCESEDDCNTPQAACDCISGCTCRSWLSSGTRHFYALMATLSLQPS